MKLGISMAGAVAILTGWGCGQPVAAPDVYAECATACDVINHLGCLGRSTLDTCKNMCTRVQLSGYLQLDVNCVVHSQTQYELGECGVVCH